MKVDNCIRIKEKHFKIDADGIYRIDKEIESSYSNEEPKKVADYINSFGKLKKIEDKNEYIEVYTEFVNFEIYIDFGRMYFDQGFELFDIFDFFRDQLKIS
jgi:hypothetical protein